MPSTTDEPVTTAAHAAPESPVERLSDTRSAWPGWPVLGSRLLDLFPEGLRGSVAPQPGRAVPGGVSTPSEN